MEHDLLEHILDGSMKPRDLPLSLLKNITGNFSEKRKIGEGGFGIVYRVNFTFQRKLVLHHLII